MNTTPQTILFQGDSITDCGRARDDVRVNSNPALGCGYARVVAGRLLADHPQARLQFFNRGISGNRVLDMQARWKPDAFKLSPDVISILIGVNDVWHEARSGTGSTPARFQKSLRDLLEWTREELPSCQLVLCEPFGLPGAELSDESLADLRGRAAVVRAFAEEFEALFVPFQTMFDKACDEAPALYWLPDGVHPSPAGHARMADLWISVTRPIFCPE